MKSILRFLGIIKLRRFFLRLKIASKYYNGKYIQILKWGLASNEDSNFTYKLTEANYKYLANTVAIICKKPLAEVYGYLNEVQQNDELRKYILEVTKNSKQKYYADLEVNFGRRLGWYAFARALKPSLIIETGVDKGLGSVLLCSALQKNEAEGFTGKYIGTDIDKRAGYLLGGVYDNFGKIIYGDSIETLKGLKEEVGLFINDSDHSADYEFNEYKAITPIINEKTIILGDNSHVTGKLLKFSEEQGRKFLFFKEVPENHWYPGGGIGISFK